MVYMASSIKILLIEDDHQLSDSVKGFLQDVGEVTQAFDGEQGEYLAIEEPFDLFIVDLMLPLMNGIEVIKSARKSKVKTPALILTAKDGLDDTMWLNTENRQVLISDQALKLVGKEYDILAYLVQNKNIIVSREQIFDRVWGMDSDTTINVVDIYISNLRRKLEHAGRPDLIQTLRNVGFLLEVK